MSREMWYGIAIGTVLTLILSVPLQFAINLMFPRVQQWFDARMKTRAFAKSKRMRKEYEEALYFHTYPHKMTHYFLNRGIELLRLGLFLLIVMLGVFHGPFATQPTTQPTTATQPTMWWSWIAFLATFGSYMFLILLVSQAVNRLDDIYLRVEFWNEYKKKVILELPDVENIRMIPS